MTSILVTGGTGSVGRVVVEQLRRRGHAVRVAGRGPGPSRTAAIDSVIAGSTAGGEEWATVDYASGAGLTAALDGIETVVHAAGGATKAAQQSMSALLNGIRTARARPHVVYISIVGVDRIPLGYYQAKYVAEQELQDFGGPYTILRATQFHELLAGGILGGLCRLPILPIPSGLSFQPIDIGVAAARLVEVAEGEPAGRVPDIGGPIVQSLDELAREFLIARGIRRRMVHLPAGGKLLTALRAGANTTPEHAVPGPTFADYLAAAAPTGGRRANPPNAPGNQKTV